MRTRTVVTVHRRKPWPVARIHRFPVPDPWDWEFEDDLDWAFPIGDRQRARAAAQAWLRVADAIMAGYRQMGEAAQRAFGNIDVEVLRSKQAA